MNIFLKLVLLFIVGNLKSASFDFKKLVAVKSDNEFFNFIIGEGDNKNIQLNLLIFDLDRMPKSVKICVTDYKKDEAKTLAINRLLKISCTKEAWNIVLGLIKSIPDLDFTGFNLFKNLCKKSLQDKDNSQIYRFNLVNWLVENRKDLIDLNIPIKDLFYSSGLWGHEKIFFYLVQNIKNFDIESLLSKREIEAIFASRCRQTGNISIIKYLIDNAKNLNVNDRFKYNWTGLGFACEQGNLELVKYLIENVKNINPNGSEGFKESPLYIAIKEKCADTSKVIKYLLSRFKNNELSIDFKEDFDWDLLLILACEVDNLNLVISIIKETRNLNLDKLDESGAALIHYTAAYNTINIIKYLINNNCNVNLESKNNTLPIEIAFIRSNTEAFELLLKYSKESKLIKDSLDLLVKTEETTMIGKFKKAQEIFTDKILSGNKDQLWALDFGLVRTLFTHTQIAEIITLKIRNTEDYITLKILLLKISEKYNLKDLIFDDTHIIWEAIIHKREKLVALILYLYPEALGHLPKVVCKETIDYLRKLEHKLNPQSK